MCNTVLTQAESFWWLLRSISSPPRRRLWFSTVNKHDVVLAAIAQTGMFLFYFSFLYLHTVLHVCMWRWERRRECGTAWFISDPRCFNYLSRGRRQIVLGAGLALWNATPFPRVMTRSVLLLSGANPATCWNEHQGDKSHFIPVKFWAVFSVQLCLQGRCICVMWYHTSKCKIHCRRMSGGRSCRVPDTCVQARQALALLCTQPVCLKRNLSDHVLYAQEGFVTN